MESLAHGQSKWAERAIVVLSALLMPIATRHAGAASIMPDEKNLSIVNEVGVTTHSMLIQEFGVSGSVLNFAGTFTQTAWSLNLEGTYSGMALALAFTGSFNPSTDSGTFVSTGTIGTSNWAASGSWNFADIDANNVSLDFSSQATITPVGGEVMNPDRKSLGKVNTRNPDGSISDTGSWALTENGKTTGKTEQESSFIRREDGGLGFATVTVGDSILVGNVNFTTGTTSGVVGIPEASTLALMACGLLVVVTTGLGWRRRKRAGLVT
jgi:hypothetical protein